MPGAAEPRSVRLMGGTYRAIAGRRYRRARRLHHERHGVVAVIGTLLALLVFFALFGIFLTQYVPLWMTDNEALLTAQAATSFASYKSSVDEQYSLDGPQSYGTPFTISSQGVPLIAQPTQGALAFLPNTCPLGFWTHGGTYSGNGAGNTATKQYGQPVSPGYCVFVNVTESIGPGGTGSYSQSVASGVLELILPNRYYTPETFYFEDDAVIQSQSTGYQIMAFPPPLNITTNAGNTSISDSFLQQYGNSSTATGQGSEEVYSHLRYSQVVSSNGGSSLTPFWYTFEIGTQYPCAWDSYLYHVVSQSGLASSGYNLTNMFSALPPTDTLSSVFPGSPQSCFNTNGATTILSFSVSAVNFATLYQAGIQVGIGVGST